MFLFKSRFKIFLQTKCFFALLGFFVLFTGSLTTTAKQSSLDEKRRVGRVQAAYLTHLIKLTHWDVSHLPKGNKSAQILILGDKVNGVVDSFKFLNSQREILIGGKQVEITHIANAEKIKAKEALSEKPAMVFLLSSSDFNIKQIKELSPHSLFIGNGRNFVTDLNGDITFEFSKNRVRLVIGKQVLKRNSPKLSSQISTLRSVVEIIP